MSSVIYCYAEATLKINDLKRQSSIIACEFMGQLDIPADLSLARLLLEGFTHGLQTVDNYLRGWLTAGFSWDGSSLLRHPLPAG